MNIQISYRTFHGFFLPYDMEAPRSDKLIIVEISSLLAQLLALVKDEDLKVRQRI